jgi:adenosylmethionine-8-amino-7-oxononanoate aminotransferase
MSDMAPVSGTVADNSLSERAQRHLWMHFTRLGTYGSHHEVPVMVRGEGAYVWDQHGKRYLDGLSGLFTSQIGHGRTELAEAASKQASELAYFPLWTYAHPRAIELAERVAQLAPGDLNRVFFTTGGSEAVESAWKLARQYFRVIGQPYRTKVVSRDIAYHGTTMGALSITGIPALKTPFEPLVPGSVKVPNTNFYRAPEHGDDLVAFGRWAADEIARAIEREGPETVAAVYLEPVQNAGGCFPPPPGYFARVREICDRYGVLLVSDEVICAFGRLGEYFGADKFGYQPDIITVAKGLTSGYAPLGAMIASDRVIEPFLHGDASFAHGFTFAGHPVSCAVAMANLDVFEHDRILEHVRSTQDAFRAALEGLYELPIVGDVRGEGFFYGIELVKDRATRESFSDEESESLLRGYLSGALFEAGLICRADDRGDPVVQLSPPLICGQPEIDLMAEVLRNVLSEAWRRI